MYQDYLDDIIVYYESLKAQSELPQNLISTTPALIKMECLSVYKTRFELRDTKMLASFFKSKPDVAALGIAIDQFDRELFKPLDNFLRGRTESTNDRNLELLAWLIDFPNRPYREEQYRNFSVVKKKTTALTSNIPEMNSDNSGKAAAVSLSNEIYAKSFGKGHPPKSTNSSIQRRSLSAATWSTVLIVAMLVWILKDNLPNNSLTNTSKNQCMYWVGDHYEKTDCNTKHRDTLVVAFDEDRFNHFKQITRTDTITLASEGKLWYLKRDKQIQCFTTSGVHPIYPDKQLHRLTSYMIEKYFNLSAKQLSLQ